jgi:hypothetical protein
VGIRETLNQNPGITTGATAAIILLALVFIIWQISGGSGPSVATEAFYSTDDGKSWFADQADKIPPFDKDGKPAYRVYVYKCKDGKEFVSHLERYTPEAKKKLEEFRTKGPEAAADPGIMEAIYMGGVEVKDPETGDKNWVKQAQFDAAAKITSPVCPDGTTDTLEPVMP